jgi:hypothetical protein
MRVALRSLIAATLLLGLGLGGCETRRIWIEVPQFGDGAIDGIWLWRLAESTQTYERACRIPFGDPEMVAARETFVYEQECGDPQHVGVELRTDVDRLAEEPQTVTIGLWYLRWEAPGTYKVSTYSADGESALSDMTLDL